ncbi:MAG TPA: alpha/beta fold hydrolase [Thermodesulfobacteriota bacterium]|nr:alpha/beta fold hydrolase [Thermodesulfobacteriota bacterium]
MALLNREGTHIYYEVHGQGPVMLLTHGFSATGRMWQRQIEAFSRNHTLILWDLRGHGRSDYPDDPGLYSKALTLADMAALLDQVGADRAIIGGLSLGGYMSLAFYREYPERVKALLIIDTGPGFRRDEAREAWNRKALAAADRYEKEGPDLLQSASLDQAEAKHRSATGLARAARGMLTQWDGQVIDSLPSIKVPTLIVAGGDDKPYLPATDYMALKIPRARKVIIPKAGHAVNIDQPEIFNEAVLSFLNNLGSVCSS